MLVLAEQSLSAPQLIRLASPLGLSATNVKSHLTRMVAEGVLRREGSARLAVYAPSADQMAVIEGIQARLRPCEEPWDGRWMMLALRNLTDRGQRDKLRGALWFDGWRSPCPNAFVRPAWPREHAEESARHFSQHGLGFCICGTFVASPEDLTMLYDLKGLDAEARRLTAWMGKRQANARSPRAAFAERMKVGARVAQLIGHDPRLPAGVWGRRRGLREMVSAYLRFEERIAPQAQIFLEQSITGPQAGQAGPRRKI
jgi:phenylacetic acid degradation operon negative regulatory protein